MAFHRILLDAHLAPSMGSPITQSDIETGSKVVLLGQTVVDKLFGSNAIHWPVRAHPEDSLPDHRRAGAQGAICHRARLRRRRVHPVHHFPGQDPGGLQKFIAGALMISACRARPPLCAESDRTLLRDRHPHSDWRRRRFQHSHLTEMASAQQEGVKTLTTLLASIAAVSLIVAASAS